MRLSVEQVKQAILHPDRDVREAAIYYFAGSSSPDPTIMPLAIQAFERYGLDAFEIHSFFARLVHTDETIGWVINEIKRVGSATNDQETRYLEALIDGLRCADADLLKQHESEIQSMDELDDDAKEAIGERIYFRSFAPDALWQELLEFCEAEEESEETSTENFEFGCSLVKALGRYPDKLAEQVIGILTDETDEFGEWFEEMAVRLAGEIRLEAAIPYLVDRFERPDIWISDAAHHALAKIGTDAVVEEIGKRFSSADTDFRFSVASTLEDIHSDRSVAMCLEFLEQEEDEDLRSSLLQAVLMNFSSAGIEPARQHVISVSKTPDSLEVRFALLVACKMMGETFPEFSAWLQDSKNDVEFRRQWYEDHPLALPDEEDEFEDDDFDEGDDIAGEDLPVDFDDEPLTTIVNRGERVGRNDPCPCGSGTKFKKCCYGKQAPDKSDESHSTVMSGMRPSKSSVEFPIGTVALYGPDDRVTTKIVAAVIKREGAEPILERWVGSNIKDSPKVKRGIKELFERHRVKSVAMSETNMGCPHEEGEDFPRGEDCPFCPYWAGKQGRGRKQ